MPRVVPSTPWSENMEYEHAHAVVAALEASPDDYIADLGVAKSGAHGAVMAMAKQMVVTGEATDVPDGVGKVLANDPSLYQRMLGDSSA
jgi:hypothetical protein